MRVRIAAYCVSLAFAASCLFAIANVALGQTIPSVPVVGPTAKDAICINGAVLPAADVNAVVMQQDLAYLERVVASKKPQPPTMRIGVVTGKAFDPGCEATVYLSGWVVEKATRVDITVDMSTPVSVVPTVTMAGYPKVWKWCLPAKWQDGKDHKLYIRAMAGTTRLGPLDNATSLNRYVVNIPAGTQ